MNTAITIALIICSTILLLGAAKIIVSAIASAKAGKAAEKLFSYLEKD